MEQLLLIFALLFGVLGLGFVLVAMLRRLGLLDASAAPQRHAAGPKGWAFDPAAFVAAPSLLTPHEQACFTALEAAVRLAQAAGPAQDAGGLRVMVQVPLSVLVDIAPSVRGTAQTSHRNRIDRKRIDFVLVDAMCRPLCAIELDDASHKRADRRARDRELEAVLAHIGLRLVRIPAAPRFDPAALARTLFTPAAQGSPR